MFDRLTAKEISFKWHAIHTTFVIYWLIAIDIFSASALLGSPASSFLFGTSMYRFQVHDILNIQVDTVNKFEVLYWEQYFIKYYHIQNEI